MQRRGRSIVAGMLVVGALYAFTHAHPAVDHQAATGGDQSQTAATNSQPATNTPPAPVPTAATNLPEFRVGGWTRVGQVLSPDGTPIDILLRDDSVTRNGDGTIRLNSAHMFRVPMYVAGLPKPLAVAYEMLDINCSSREWKGISVQDTAPDNSVMDDHRLNNGWQPVSSVSAMIWSSVCQR